MESPRGLLLSFGGMFTPLALASVVRVVAEDRDAFQVARIHVTHLGVGVLGVWGCRWPMDGLDVGVRRRRPKISQISASSLFGACSEYQKGGSCQSIMRKARTRYPAQWTFTMDFYLSMIET
jgi:hypothetical protein